LLGKGDDSAVIILFAPENQPGGGQAAMENFVSQAGDAVEAVLAQARANR